MVDEKNLMVYSRIVPAAFAALLKFAEVNIMSSVVNYIDALARR